MATCFRNLALVSSFSAWFILASTKQVRIGRFSSSPLRISAVVLYFGFGERRCGCRDKKWCWPCILWSGEYEFSAIITKPFQFQDYSARHPILKLGLPMLKICVRQLKLSKLKICVQQLKLSPKNSLMVRMVLRFYSTKIQQIWPKMTKFGQKWQNSTNIHQINTRYQHTFWLIFFF